MSQQVPPQAKSRLDWVDTAKGIAIILVVIGHTLRGMVSARIIPHSPTEAFVDSWIYAFHMPLFFFLSGLFLPRSVRKAYPEFVEDKLRTIAYPYFVWSAITLVFKSVLGRFTNHPASLQDGWRITFAPIEQFWFLYVLFLLMLILGGLLKLGLKPWMLVAASLVAHPALVPIPGGFWGPAIQARTFAIYVALGAWFGSGPLLSEIAKISPSRLVAVTVAGFAGLTAMVAWHLQETPAVAILMALLGSAACLAAAVALSGRTIIDPVLHLCGQYSLEIYVAHTMASAAARIALQKGLHVQNPTAHLIVGTLAGLVLSIAFGILCRRLGLDALFTLRKSPPPTSPAPKATPA